MGRERELGVIVFLALLRVLGHAGSCLGVCLPDCIVQLSITG